MNNKGKKFLTYNQQMKYLRDQKSIICSGTSDKAILCRKGYFNIINGYKTPFTCGRDSTGEHIYSRDTSITHFHALKEFDDDLRFLLFKHLSKTEEEIRTFTAYKFDEVNLSTKSAWYEVSAYSTSHDVTHIIQLISKAYSELSRSKQEYVKHYIDNHKVIPTWVLTKFIRFATFVDFIKYGNDEIKRSLCELYSIYSNNGHPNYKLLINSLHWIRTIRNMCAHNERVYDCKRANGRINESYIMSLPQSYQNERDQKIIDLLIYLKYYLSSDEYCELITEIKSLLLKLQNKLHNNAYDNVRASIGFKDINHLDLLLMSNKTISYHKFR